MGTGLILPGLLDVTDPEFCSGLLECQGVARGSGKQRQRMDRTLNRHRWTGRACQGA
jgi:hypothetical protein